MNNVTKPYPSDWNDFPPDWMKADVESVLGMIVSGVLYTREGLVNDYGWIRHDHGPAQPISDDESSTTHIMVERGFVIWAESATLSSESGETFTAARMVLTPAGHQLHEQLSKRK
ncbi:hypothetical protein [Lentzea sp. NPDC051838]|uniref:hypothetical protein n=1 Tax=Lentzea sp. NPDC051838 TaxID=3154849 RepID=UPI0034347CF8